MTNTGVTATAGDELMRQFVPSSPFVRHLGMHLVDIGAGKARLALPFSETLATMGNTVHGGAISSLIDSAAMAAAWSTACMPDRLRGTTVGLTVSYLAPANGEDIEAEARVLRRGRSLIYLDVDVHTTAGRHIAKGLVTYKMG